jgi:tryptophan synthase beta chain
LGRVEYKAATDDEAIDAFFKLSKLEGIIPALESAHAVAFAMKLAKVMKTGSILVNCSGRGDKDLDFVLENYGDRLAK